MGVGCLWQVLLRRGGRWFDWGWRGAITHSFSLKLFANLRIDLALFGSLSKDFLLTLMSTSTNTLPTEDVPDHEDVEEGLFSRCVKILPLSPPRPLKPPQKPWPLTSDISSRICGGALEEEPRSIHPKRTWSFFQARERLTSGYVCHLVTILYPWLQLRRYLPRSGEVKKLTILKHTHTHARWIIHKFALGVKRVRLLLGIFKRMQRLNMHILKL